MANQSQYMNTITATYNVVPSSPRQNTTIGFKNADYNKWSEDQKVRDNWNYGLQAGAMAANTGLSITSMALNYAVQKEYFKAQREGMKYQLRLGLAGIDLEMDRNRTMKDITEDNNKTAIKVSKLQANAQVKIASIGQRGLTDRAKVFAAYNAFHNRYPMGNPV